MSNVSTTGNLAVGGTASITGITTLSSALNTSANIVQSGANSIQAGTAGLISNLLSYTTGAVSIFTSAISSMTLGYSGATLTIASPTTHTSTLNMGSNTLSSTGAITTTGAISGASLTTTGDITVKRITTLGPIFSVYLTSNYSAGVNNSTVYTVPFTGADFNTNSYYDTVTTYQFTCPLGWAGYYQFNTQITLANNASATTIGYAKLFKGSSGSIVSEKILGSGYEVGTTNYITIGGSCIFSLNVGDYVGVQFYFISGSGDFVSTTQPGSSSANATWFQGYFLHS